MLRGDGAGRERDLEGLVRIRTNVVGRKLDSSDYDVAQRAVRSHVTHIAVLHQIRQICGVSETHRYLSARRN